MSKTAVLEVKNTSLAAARAIAAKADDEGRDFTDAERVEVTAHMEKARDADRELKTLDGDADLRAELNAMGFEVGELAKNGGHSKGRGRTTGEQVTESAEFKSWMTSIAPNGQVPERSRVHSPAVAFEGVKALLTGASDTSAGALVTADSLGLRDGGTFQRPLTARSLVTNGTTQSDAVEYARVTGFTNGAAPTAEATSEAVIGDGTGGTTTAVLGGRKPKSSLTLEKVTATVKTVAHWLPATKRSLSDASQIRTMIDNFLTYGLEEELEDQIINGDGTGEDFEGVLEVSGIQAQAWDTNLLVTTRKAKTKVRTVGRATATAYLFNPADNERIDLLRDDAGGAGTGSFLFGSPAGNQLQTLWGLPRVESEAVPSGVGIVADWRQAVLWDREQAAIQVSDAHEDYFVRNLVAILAEMRAAFGIMRPKAFVTIDLTA
jgi:HK97 family phage major capsid protein